MGQEEVTHWTGGWMGGLHRRSKHYAEENPPSLCAEIQTRTSGCQYVMIITVRATGTQSPHVTLHLTRRGIRLEETLHVYVQCRST